MRDHIHTVVGRYKGKIKVWDVVNEAISDDGPNILRVSPWQQIIGDDFIEKAFEYAHEADPDAILRYNDYSLENPVKRQKTITMVKALLAKKVPVGNRHANPRQRHFAQLRRNGSHYHRIGNAGFAHSCDRTRCQQCSGGQRNTGADVANNAATTQGGLVSDAEKRLANQYANLFRLPQHKGVTVVTLWGVNDGVSWRAAGKPLLFDANDEPKAAFNAVMQAAKDN